MIPMTLRMKRCYGQNPISPSLYNQVLTPSVNLKILWSTSRKSLVKKRRDPRQSSPSARMWGHSEKTSYLQAKKKVLPTSTLILDFQTPKLWEKSLLFKPLVCGILLGQPEKTVTPGQAHGSFLGSHLPETGFNSDSMHGHPGAPSRTSFWDPATNRSPQ